MLEMAEKAICQSMRECSKQFQSTRDSTSRSFGYYSAINKAELTGVNAMEEEEPQEAPEERDEEIDE